MLLFDGMLNDVKLPIQARRRWGSRGSNEHPLQVNDGG